MAKTEQCVRSMTGFARKQGGDGRVAWTWEVKSVNGRNLDIRCRVPSGYEALDAAARATAAAHCARGNLQIGLTVDRGETPLTLRVNRALLDDLLELTRELQAELAAPPPQVEGLLAVRGVIETVEEKPDKDELDSREAAMEEDLVLAFEALDAMRRGEGERLRLLASGHLMEIERLVAAAAASAAVGPDALRERLRKQVAELLEASPGLPEERLAQEAALLVGKADVREEIDRLTAHVAAARELLAAGGAIGRRLDFLCQEFNREANTLCSKSWDVSLTRIGLDLKAVIDQLREQIQNIE